MTSHPNDSVGIEAGIQLYLGYYSDHEDSLFSERRLLFDLLKKAKKAKYIPGIVSVNYYLGNNYLQENKIKDAITFFFTSLKLSEAHNYENGIAKATMGIGIICYNQMNYPKALDYFKRALALSKKSNHLRLAYTQQYLIALCLLEEKEYAEATSYMDSAIQLTRSFNDRKRLNECLMGAARILEETSKLDTARSLIKSLLPEWTSKNELVGLSLAYSSLGRIALRENDLKLARSYAGEALRYADSANIVLTEIKAREINYRVFSALGDNKAALNHYKKYSELKDSIQNLDIMTQFGIAQASYDYEKKEAAIKAEQDRKNLEYSLELKAKNRNQRILTAISILSLLFVVVVIFAYRFIRKQKKISEDLLLNILPEETSQELKKYGKALSKNHTGVSIMFCDVKNFTVISEKLTPEVLVDMLDTYFRNFDMICTHYGLEKIKTIGDAYMCVAGLHGHSEKSAKEAVHTAIGFQKFSKSIENSMMQKYGQAFQFRVGIHTGNITSGVVGLKKYAYDIWGDAVNTAARMEQNSEPGKINITGSTYRALDNEFKCTYRGKIEAKNKGFIDMYFVDMD